MAYKEGQEVWLKPKNKKAKYHIDLKGRPFVSYFNEQGDIRTWESVRSDELEDYDNQDLPSFEAGDLVKNNNYENYLFVVLRLNDRGFEFMCISDDEDQIFTKGATYRALGEIIYEWEKAVK